ncbi:sialate O-acetylesterase [Polaribacter sp. KT25b]|uniref:sialate O-acetylesterase n=1 Tax=Polaribacter sp. KT25b TaxID=1855336 RepID=UPI00087BC649|nr:sialate O-acetylesterase [Polaribacter sp. KT25b]SDR65412.1 sialate O-acetylesterase [Polaribacter sp. KT25b]
MKRAFRVCNISIRFVGFLFLLSIGVGSFAQTTAMGKSTNNIPFQLGSLFKDHMVLQRDVPIPVWGKATAGTTVTVKFANSKKQTIADSNGKWSVKLDALKASFDSKTMLVSSSMDKKTIKISDVLVGEVWICSGQSNMQFSVNGAPEVKKLIPSAKNIRSFKVKNTVALEPQDTCEGTWEVNYPNSAVAFSFAYFLEKSANVPVGIILTAWGSSSLEAWMPKDMVETVPHFKTMMEEFDADDKTKNRITAILNGKKPWGKEDDIFLRRQSNILYNAMMHPLMPYACKGIVWYQGERNTQSMHGMIKEPWFSRNSGMLKYGDVLKEWVKRYRKGWDNDDLHFLVVMLPGYGKELKTDKNIAANTPNAHSWAWMRESQLKVLELPHTSVANIIDLGDYKNIHPKDKLPVGKRLALLARKDVLGEKITALGPTLKKVKIKKNTVIVRFKNAKKLKTTDGKSPTGFWLADEANRWFPAKATIKGKRVILTSSSLENPLYVRYAFTGKPDVNLENEANLPAYPFRTDSFKP